MKERIGALRNSVQEFTIKRWLTSGFLVLLTGLFWLEDGSLYTRFYYALIVAPVFFCVLNNPARALPVLKEPSIQAYLCLTIWIAISLSWSSSDVGVGSLLKRPVYVFILFIGLCMVALKSEHLLMQTLRLGAAIGAIAALINIVLFWLDGQPGGRMIGTGALRNPLLTSHVLGFLCTYWVASWLSCNERYDIIPILLASVLLIALLATGSRTPLMALVLTSFWMLLVSGRRAVYLVMSLFFAALLATSLMPELLLGRGVSFRPQLWMDAIDKASGHLWLGGGYDSRFIYDIPGVGMLLHDPHNVELAVLLELGLIGLIIWSVMYAFVFYSCLKFKSNASVQIGSALLVYGIGAGLTEGGNFLSRPNESWFIIWIPLALCCALSVTLRQPKDIE